MIILLILSNITPDSSNNSAYSTVKCIFVLAVNRCYSQENISVVQTVMYFSPMNEWLPFGSVMPWFRTNGVSCCPCTSSLRPAPGFGPFMYSYCSRLISRVKPDPEPGGRNTNRSSTWNTHKDTTSSKTIIYITEQESVPDQNKMQGAG